MSVFVDTGVFYAHHDRDATRHEAATEAMDRSLSGEFGRIFTSDYVFDETVTLTRSHTGRFADAKSVGDRIRGVGDYPEAVEMLYVDEEVFEAAVAAFERYDDRPISFTDATTVALVEEHDLDAVMTFDEDFDGVVDRLDPTDVA